MPEFTWLDLNDWYDVVGIFALIVSGWVTTFITIRSGQKRAVDSHSELNEKVDQVRTQVANGHTTPLRQDMDEMRGILQIIRDELHTIRRDIFSVHSDMSSIRAELGVERDARTDLEHRLDEDHPRSHRRKPTA